MKAKHKIALSYLFCPVCGAFRNMMYWAMGPGPSSYTVKCIQCETEFEMEGDHIFLPFGKEEGGDCPLMNECEDFYDLVDTYCIYESEKGYKQCPKYKHRQQTRVHANEKYTSEEE